MDERGKCTVRVEFLAVFVAVKLQGPSEGFAPGPHQGSFLDPLGGLTVPPDPQLEQAMTFGHCMSCRIPPAQAWKEHEFQGKISHKILVQKA